ncbi:hypothetical protein F6Y05_32760 [Bacillus megaterium]|nr:hypothetical protein [Priestia megaterium]
MGEEAFMPAFASLIAVYGEYEKGGIWKEACLLRKFTLLGIQDTTQFYRKTSSQTSFLENLKLILAS